MTDLEYEIPEQIEADNREEHEEAIEATKDIQVPDANKMTDDDAEEFARKIITRAAKLKAVKIDRGTFLRTELRKFSPGVDTSLAVSTTPLQAGASPSDLDEMAKAAISLEVKKCAGLSFLAGIPGGLAMVGTVPADLAQYFAHVMRVEQKLAYVYGWQSFLDENDEVDDETVMKLVVLMGVMMGVGNAANTLTKFASTVAQAGVAKTIQKQALTKTTFYPVMKSVLRVIGIQLTKETFAKTVSKMVPVVGGAVSGGLTYASFKPGAESLRKYLRALPISGIAEAEAEEKKSAAAEVAEVAADQARQIGDAAAQGAKAVGSVAARAAKEGATSFAGKLKMSRLKGFAGQKPEVSQADTASQLPIQNQVEELKALKDLLDLGILTQEEFDAKKKQILGL